MTSLPRLGIALCAIVAVAASASTLAVTGGWTRPTARGMNAAAYFTIVNRGASPDALISASSPLATSASLHESHQMGTVMTMRPLAAIPLPRGRKVLFAPGGLHLMLEGLKRPLRGGERVPVRLVFRRGAAQRVELVVGEGPPA